jgi:hypothetical protein
MRLRRLLMTAALAAVTAALSAPTAMGATALSVASGLTGVPAPNQCVLSGTNFYQLQDKFLGEVSRYKVATQSTINCPGPVSIYANEQLTNFITQNPLDGGATNLYVCGSFCSLGVQTDNAYQAGYAYTWHIGYEMIITDPANYYWDPGPYKNCTVVDPEESKCDVTVELTFVPNKANMDN